MGPTRFLPTGHVQAVRMIHPRREPAFAKKSPPKFRRIQRLIEHLKGDATAADNVFGFVDRAHAASAEEPE